MNHTLISRHSLDNGLTSELWDCSTPMAGDRWQLVLEIRIIIPVNAATLPADLKARTTDVKEVLGPEVAYTQRTDRNFVSVEEKPAVLREMEQRLTSLATSYLNHRQFAVGVIRREYAQLQARRHWQPT